MQIYVDDLTFEKGQKLSAEFSPSNLIPKFAITVGSIL